MKSRNYSIHIIQQGPIRNIVLGEPLMHSCLNALRPRSPISERTEKAPNFQQERFIDGGLIIPQILHVWNIYLHLP